EWKVNSGSSQRSRRQRRPIGPIRSRPEHSRGVYPMSVVRVVVLSWFAALFVASPAFAQPAGNASLLPAESPLNRRGLTRRWWGHAVLNTSREKLAHLANDEHYLFAQSTSGTVTAFDCESGKQLWARNIGAADRPIQLPAMNDEMLVVVNGLSMIG